MDPAEVYVYEVLRAHHEGLVEPLEPAIAHDRIDQSEEILTLFYIYPALWIDRYQDIRPGDIHEIAVPDRDIVIGDQFYQWILGRDADEVGEEACIELHVQK